MVDRPVGIAEFVVGRGDRSVGADSDIDADMHAVTDIDHHSGINRAIATDMDIAFTAGGLDLDKGIYVCAVLDDDLAAAHRILDVGE